MTRIIGILLVFTLFISSCAPESKTVTITANIANSSAPSAKIFNNSMEIEAEVKDGSFSTSFDIDQPQYVNLRIGRESTELFITPGQELSIAIDVKNFDESVSYSGDGTEASQYLAAKYLDQEENQIPGPDLFSMDEEQFLKTLEEQESKGIEFLNQFSEKNSLSKSFKEIEGQNIAFQQNAKKLSYESAHKYYAKAEDFKISEEFQNHIDQVDLNQSQLLQAPQFQSFVNSFLMNKAYANFLENQDYQKMGMIGIVKAQLDLIPDVISDPQVSDFAASSAVMNHLSYGSALGIESFMDQLKSMTSSPRVFEKIKTSMEEWGHLAKGQAAPNFEGKTLEGQSVNLSDLKGKHVYIDVWATWCGPCKAEQPALFALEDQYKDNENIAFVGMSIDENKEAWQKMVSEKDMMGIQIIGDNAWQSSICIDYKIKGIPRFILIDKDGKILNADAPRPSSDQIKEILKELAGEPLLTVL